MQYSGNSTAHGISYIFEKGQSVLERILWLFAVSIAITVAIYFSIIAYVNWKDQPVITSLFTTSLSIEEIPFPAITICGQGLIKQVVQSAIFQQFSQHLENEGKTMENLTLDQKDSAYQVNLRHIFQF